jgi:hypothetical protein
MAVAEYIITILARIVPFLIPKNVVEKSQSKFCAIMDEIKANRHKISIASLQLLKEALNKKETDKNFSYLFLLTDTFVKNLIVLKIYFNDRAGIKGIFYENRMYNKIILNALPFKINGEKFRTMSDAIGRLCKPKIFEDRCAYRLISIRREQNSTRLFYDRSPEFSYFDQINFHSFLEFELAKELHKKKWDVQKIKLRNLPFRKRVMRELVGKDFNQFSGYPFFSGVSTIVLLVKKNSFRILMHKRGETGTVSNNFHVIPAGEFQPINSNPGCFERDFNIWYSILREYCEEIRGDKEVTGETAKEIDYNSSIYKQIQDIILASDRYFLGIGLGPTTYKVEILTCLVIPYNSFLQTLPGENRNEQEKYVQNFQKNNEGDVVAYGEEIGIALKPDFEEVDKYIDDNKTLDTAKEMLSIIKKNYSFFNEHYLSK